MSNPYYNHTSGTPVAQQRGTSSAVRAEFDAIQAGFNALPSPSQLYGGSANYAVDTGGTNAYVINVNAVVTALTDGMEFNVKIGAANTGAATLAVNGLAAVPVTRNDGSPLQLGDFAAGSIVALFYNASQNRFQFAPPGAKGATGATGATAFGVSPVQYASNMATDTLVTASQGAYIVASSTAFGISIKLDDARNYSYGASAPRIVVKNSGPYQIGVRDNTGTLLTGINPGGIAYFGLEAQVTQAGVWDVQGSGLTPLLWLQCSTLISGGNTHQPLGIVQLSATLAILITYNGGNTYGTVYDMAANTVGTTTLLYAGNVGTIINNGLLALDNTHGLVCGAGYIVAFQVSGVAIVAVGAAVAMVAGSANCAAVLSSGSFVTAGANGTSAYVRAYTVSGVTITAGAHVSVYNASPSVAWPTAGQLLVRSPTQVLVFGGDTGNSWTFVVHATISGTSVAANGSSHINGTGNSVYMSAPVLNATDEWWFFVNGTTMSQLVVAKLTVSGATPALTQGLSVSLSANFITYWCPTQKINNSTFATMISTYSVGSDFYIVTASSIGAAGTYDSNRMGANAQWVPMLQYTATGSSSSSAFNGYVVDNATMSTLLHIDESFTGFVSNPLSADTIAGASRPLCGFRFATKDILLGYGVVGGSGGAGSGRGLWKVNNSIPTAFSRFDTPALLFDSQPQVSDQLRSIGTNKACIQCASGRFSSFEVAA